MRPGEVADELDAFFGGLPTRVKKDVELETASMLAQIKGERFRPWQPLPTPHGSVYDRSGALKDALRTLVSDVAGQVRSRLFIDPGSPKEQMKASVSEFGKAGITAHFGQAMAIPIGPALDGRGVRKYSSVADARGDYSIWREADFLVGKARGLRGSSIVPSLYRLKRVVNVPAKKWAEPEVAQSFERISARIEEMFHKFSQGLPQ